MTETKPPTGESSADSAATSDIASEFRQLGNNLKSILQSAWESEERKKLQQEIESGLAELGDSLNKTISEFKESPEGQRLKADVDDFRTRLRSGEVEVQARGELLSILRKVNDELQKATSPQAKPPSEAGQKPGEG
jgi:HD-GYP domain-containing protein (c-di-GMP phosphodiesterase class II)